MRLGKRDWSLCTKGFVTVTLLVVAAWLCVARAAEPPDGQGGNPGKTQGQTGYQLRQVVVSGRLEKGQDENTVTLRIGNARATYMELKTADDAAAKPTEWAIDDNSLIGKSWWSGWTPKTIWRTDNLVYGDCLHVTTGSSRGRVMTLRHALDTGQGMLTLDDDDLSLGYEEEESPTRLNVNIKENSADAKKLLEDTCKGKETRFEQFSVYETRGRAHTALHGENPRNHGSVVITEPEACSGRDAPDACRRLPTALKAAECKEILAGTLWRCPNPGDGKWDQVVRNNDGAFVAAGRSIETFGPDVVGIYKEAMAARIELAGVSPEQSKWVNGVYGYGERSRSLIEISVDRDGNKVWAYVPKGKWYDEITWSFVCSPTRPQKGKFNFRKVKWHKLKVRVKADNGTKHVAVGWRLSVPSADGTQIILDQDGTTEGARILARFAPVMSPKGMVQLTVSPSRGEWELMFEPVLIIVNPSRLCPITARPEPNELVLDIEPSPRTLKLSLKHFAGVAQKVMLPSTGPERWIRLSDKDTSIELNALTEIEVTLDGRTAQPENYREFMAALKQQNQEERCAALRNLFPGLYNGRVVIYAPDTANIPVRILRQGGPPEVGFAKRIGGGFQTYSVQGSNVQVLTNGSWEEMSTKLGCGFEGIGPRSAYVIVDTGEFSHSQGKRGKAEECDDDDLGPLQRALFRCGSDESVSTVSDPAMFEAVWILCLERLHRNLVAAGADQITIVQAHADRQGGIGLSRVAFVPLSLYDESAALQKFADAGYDLRRRAETAVRSDKYQRAMSGVEIARAHLETLASRDEATKKLPMHVVFSRPHGQREGRSQTLDAEMGAQLWIVPGLLTKPSCPIAPFDAHNITEGENQ